LAWLRVRCRPCSELCCLGLINRATFRLGMSGSGSDHSGQPEAVRTGNGSLQPAPQGIPPPKIPDHELIRKIGREKTVLISTHILPEVQAACTRVLILHRGRLVADGEPGDLAKPVGDVALAEALFEPSPGLKEDPRRTVVQRELLPNAVFVDALARLIDELRNPCVTEPHGDPRPNHVAQARPHDERGATRASAPLKVEPRRAARRVGLELPVDEETGPDVELLSGLRSCVGS